MIRVRLIALALGVCSLLGLAVGVAATEVDCDTVYCFTGQEFADEEDALQGICITGLPDPATGTVLLGCRVLREGDILTAQQLEEMTFQPLLTKQDTQAVISYLPIYKTRVDGPATMTIGIRGKEDKAPVAVDSAIETYKNLPNTGTLNVADPEGKEMTFTVTRNPKRGTVEIGADGTFTYTPKRNKVGVDSFVYTATDPAGNVSRQATVTIQILKPGDSKQYADTIGSEARFAAEWMRHSGLFVGEQVGGSICFNPEKTVSRGEFLAMTVKLLEIPVDKNAQMAEDVPQWLKPYLLAAQRSGLTANWQTTDGYNVPITGAEAAVILQNALDLTVSSDVLAAEKTAQWDENLSAHASASLTVLAENGISFNAGQAMTRADVANVLYQVSKIAPDAPGMVVFRMQQ